MRVPGGALRLARRVLDLAHLVEVDERIEVGQGDAGEGAANRKPSPSKPRGAVVTERTGRTTARAESGNATLGRVVMSSTVIAGMTYSLVVNQGSDSCLLHFIGYRLDPRRAGLICSLVSTSPPGPLGIRWSDSPPPCLQLLLVVAAPHQTARSTVRSKP